MTPRRTCDLCEAVALYQVGDRRFCKVHQPEAIKASRGLGSKRMGFRADQRPQRDGTQEECMSTALTTPTTISPMQLIQSAVAQGAQIDTIERLVALQEKMMKHDAELAFNGAMHAAQGEMKRIGADAVNPQTRSKYATFVKVDGALRPIYSKQGFSLSFDTEPTGDTNTLRVVCYVRHIGGHTSIHKIDMPADGKGAKGNDVMTKTHATGAAFQYGKRYLELGIFNVTVGDSDDDGNGASGVPDWELTTMVDNIRAASSLEELQSIFKSAWKLADAKKDTEAIRELTAAKDARKRELAQ